MDRQTITLNDNDVIKGRGNGANLNPGNIRFRQLVKVAKEGYVLSSKADKKKYAVCIMKHIRSLNPPGRFLDKDENGRWFELEQKKALAKTRQALREEAPAIEKAQRKKIEQIFEEQSEPVFLDMSSLATSDTTGNIHGINESNTMPPLRSINPSPAHSYAANSISNLSAVTNQTLTCGLCGADVERSSGAGGSSGAGDSDHDVDSLSDCTSLADFGCDELDEKPPANMIESDLLTGENVQQTPNEEEK